MYYDVCEDPEELQSILHTGIQQAEPPTVSQLRRRLQTLETKRGNICARRAYLRNKKVQIAFRRHPLVRSDPLLPFWSFSRGNVLISE